MRFYVLVLFIVVITGCKSMQPVIQQTTTITEILHDTTVIISQDTASIRALFECDSLNQVIMKELTTVNGRRLKPEVIFQDKILTVLMPVDSQSVYVSWKERHEVKAELTTVTKVEKVIEKPPWYLKALAWIGATAIVSLIIILAVKLR